MLMKDLFIAEATIKKQHVNKRYFPGHYSHFRYLCSLSRKTISYTHDRFTLGLKHIAL